MPLVADIDDFQNVLSMQGACPIFAADSASNCRYCQQYSASLGLLGPSKQPFGCRLTTHWYRQTTFVPTFVWLLPRLLLPLQLVEKLLSMTAYLHCCLGANMLCKKPERGLLEPSVEQHEYAAWVCTALPLLDTAALLDTDINSPSIFLQARPCRRTASTKRWCSSSDQRSRALLMVYGFRA